MKNIMCALVLAMTCACESVNLDPSHGGGGDTADGGGGAETGAGGDGGAGSAEPADGGGGGAGGGEGGGWPIQCADVSDCPKDIDATDCKFIACRMGMCTRWTSLFGDACGTPESPGVCNHGECIASM